ncbi:hypothetical protein P154DRAFT_535261 [Amniculicola lignicola CBS 123094]|uniref:Uncharacterized protein n=1 Tax=Amniculicola lignicola CBS 123094 TaxID=1392246 RepID=A0A6A5WG50_9PLEO|nr:hypothetical protein P154DRAFT_535261 [Amniculicola lignicola CBS 123094]
MAVSSSTSSLDKDVGRLTVKEPKPTNLIDKMLAQKKAGPPVPAAVQITRMMEERRRKASVAQREAHQAEIHAAKINAQKENTCVEVKLEQPVTDVLDLDRDARLHLIKDKVQVSIFVGENIVVKVPRRALLASSTIFNLQYQADSTMMVLRLPEIINVGSVKFIVRDWLLQTLKTHGIFHLRVRGMLVDRIAICRAAIALGMDSYIKNEIEELLKVLSNRIPTYKQLHELHSKAIDKDPFLEATSKRLAFDKAYKQIQDAPFFNDYLGKPENVALLKAMAPHLATFEAKIQQDLKQRMASKKLQRK